MRLSYTPDPPSFPSNPDAQDLVDKLVAGRPAGAGLGPLFRTLLLTPTLSRGFLQFFTAVRYRSSLPPDIMELAMCRVGALNGAAYEWMHHAPLLRKAGVSEEGVETVRTASAGKVGAEGEGGLSKRLWVVMRYVDAMTKDVKVPDDVFEGMRGVMMREMEDKGEQGIVELTLTICGYNAISRFLLAMDVAELKDVEVGKAKL